MYVYVKSQRLMNADWIKMCNCSGIQFYELNNRIQYQGQKFTDSHSVREMVMKRKARSLERKEIGTINKSILRGFLQKWKVECRADSLVPMRFAIFPLHLSKVLRLPRKSDARSYKVLHLSRKIILANLKIWCSKMQPLSGNHHPDLLTAPMKMSLVLRLPGKMHLCRSSSNVPRLPSFLAMLQNPHVLLTFEKVHNPLRLPRETTSEPPKVARTCGVLYMLASKCASRHNGVHFFDISTSKSGPNMWCFVHFEFEMCFAPQRRALFQHRNFQKCSEHVVFCTFWLRNVLRARTACTFSSLIWPDGSAPAALASLLFDRPEPQIIGKTQCFATFLPFRVLTLSLLWSSLFYSSLLSDSFNLCFSFVHIVGSLTSKLPSATKRVDQIVSCELCVHEDSHQRSWGWWIWVDSAWRWCL